MGKKKMKDPLAPKPPLNAYMEFVKEERPKIHSELGSITTKEMGRELGERWKNLNDDEREKFLKRSRDNQEQYRIRKIEYEKTNKKQKNPLTPKLPLSSYMEFAMSERPKILSDLGNLTLGEIGKEMGRRWKCLDRQKKEIFEKKSKENRERYEKELELFQHNSALNQEVTVPHIPHTLPAPNSHPFERITPSPSDPELDPPCLPSNPSPPHPYQDPQVPNLPSRSDLQPALQSSSQPIKLADLGFAKQDGFDWHPALKTGAIARGTRVKVTFFGTGQVATVNKSSWLLYSDHAEAKIKTKKLFKSITFVTALEQMKSLKNKILQGSPVTTSGIGFEPQMAGRRFKSLNKDHLQSEEEENSRKMEKKMFQKEGSSLWNCRDCAWQGKFRHKAKAHARDCGQRKRINQKKSRGKEYECSNADCDQSFALKSQLSKHYRSVHFQGSHGYNCVSCEKSFKAWKNFKRHNEEIHGKPSFFNCSLCPFKSKRRYDLLRHQKGKHRSKNSKFVSSLLDKLLDKIFEKKSADDIIKNMEKQNDNQIVSEVIDTLLTNAVTVGEQKKQQKNAEGPEISEYERIRNEIVAEREAEFRKRFPTFQQEVRALRVVRTTLPRRKKLLPSTPVRRSDRNRCQSDHPEGLAVEVSTDNSADVVEENLDSLELSSFSGGFDEFVSAQHGNEASGGGDTDLAVPNTCIDEDEEHNQDEANHTLVGVGGRQGERGDGDMGQEVTAVTNEERDAAEKAFLGKHGCLPCGMSFGTGGNLRRHVKLVHSARQIPVQCPRPWCSMEFSILADMILHKKLCVKLCPACNKVFTREDKFEAHQRAHRIHDARMV